MFAFDKEKYFKIQKEAILKRINKFGDKLYLEFGGKLLADFHASRVLSGFEPDAKLKMLLTLKKQIEVIITINCNDIMTNKAHHDTNLSYQDEVKNLINIFNNADLDIAGIVFSFYQENDNYLLTNFINYLKEKKIKIYKHYKIDNYPENIELVVSENGFGKNEYVKTTKPLIIVTAPGPGSGKMATCLSQLYHDNKNNIKAGYAKYELFPVWNLPLKHPVNLAYEAATLDLNDVNLIDPYHLETYKIIATNYNRDVASFPLLKKIFEKIYGYSPYKSPTDMGVNMAGFAIINEKIAIKNSNDEIIRRYYQALKKNFLGIYPDETIEKAKILMSEANLSIDDRECVKACLNKFVEINTPCIAISLKEKNKIITGKCGKLLNASAALLINVLKTFAKINDDILVLSPKNITTINDLKKNILKENNPKINIKDVLIILSIQADNNKLAKLMLQCINELKGLQAHSATILSYDDLEVFNKLGIQITEEINNYSC